MSAAPSLHPDPSEHDGSPERMLAMRRRLDLTQRDFARMLGVEERQYRRWETAGGYGYAAQYLAESLVRREEARWITHAVKGLGGDERGRLLALTLYLSGRASPHAAVDRGVEHTRELRRVERLGCAA